ncbi:hypothetical protein [Flavobacterium sp. SM2513]|uniref:hypothetical protein n=1 Tax=Flavobacterium sp. SM2513 TaxID=3424766 RepID=UPI003D7F7FD1
MLYLPHHSSDKIALYFNLIKNKIILARKASSLDKTAIDYLTDMKIEQIIFSKPQKLLEFHKEIISKLFVGASIREYKEYCLIKNKNEANRLPQEILIYNRYYPHIEELKKVFNYNDFITRHKITSYKLAEILNQNTCVYCNRLYTSTVVVKDEVTNRVNDSTRIMRPTYDHWYSKSKYPVLSLSFYNLIPSCSVCNTSVKGDTEFSMIKHIHPYKKENNQDFKFNYIYKDVHKNNVVIDFPNQSKIGRTLKDLKIKDIYNGHSEYELKDLLELRYKYSENYLDTLFNKTFDIHIGKKELYRLIFGIEPKEVNFHKRPFSKFKKDILEKLGIKV